MAKQTRPLKTLLVEDNPADALIVNEQLESIGVNFDMDSQETLASALEQLSTSRFDIVLLDLALPDSHGLETFQRVQELAQDIPIVILSGREDEEFAVEAVREGAQDYLLKGTFDAKSLLRAIRYAIERTRRLKIEKELRSAAEIQRRLLPKASSQVHGFDIAGKCAPATYVGGDYFDFFPMGGSSRIGVVIADAAGHGIGPAMTMTETRAVIRAIAATESDVGEILTRANNVLARNLSEQTFVALFLACIDSTTRQLQYAAAGHRASILNEHGRERDQLTSADPPLGIQGHKYAASEWITLNKGESLFLFTDGLVDCENAEGDRFGSYRLMEAVVASHNAKAHDWLSGLLREVATFVGSTPRSDDLSAVFVCLSAQNSQGESTKTDTAGDAEEEQTETACAVRTHDEWLEVVLRGENVLTTEACISLHSELARCIELNGDKHVVLSLENVTKFSSEAINVLLQVRRALESRGLRIVLCEMSHDIRVAFESLNLAGMVFAIKDDIAASLTELRVDR